MFIVGVAGASLLPDSTNGDLFLPLFFLLLFIVLLSCSAPDTFDPRCTRTLPAAFAMESPTRPTLSPSKALHPVSPERMNQQGLPASPSLPADLLSLHHKNAKGVSEVQAKVAFLNGLSRGGSPVATSSADKAALQRAILGREEAESALTIKEEELSESQTRERLISERVESLLEELHNTKERRAHERSIFEKEIRKARKEAFRAGSTLVKVQEELKHSKSEVKALKDEIAVERESKDKAKQEAFERAYALAGLTEEFEVLKGRLRSVEADNHSSTLEVRAHEIQKEDFGRLSIADGDLALLATPRRPKRAAEDSFNSPLPATEEEGPGANTPPKRQRLTHCSPETDKKRATIEDFASDHDNDLLDDLKEELKYEKRRRVEAEEMVHFLNIECQFERCSCRIAESQGRRYIYDEEYYEKVQKHICAEAFNRSSHSATVAASQTPVPTPVNQNREPTVKAEPADPPEQMPMPEDPVVTFSPETGTFRTFPSPLRDNVRKSRPAFATPDLVEPQAESASSGAPYTTFTPSGHPVPTRLSRATPSDVAVEDPIEPPRSRRHQSERENDEHEHSSTEKVPLRAESESHSSSHPPIPDTPINREEALAQIRARRGKARSTKRSVSENEATGRSGSSSAVSAATTPARGPRRIPNVRTDSKSEGDLGERRDLSAPIRMFRR